MKSQNFLLKLLSIAAIFGLVSVAQAQFFTFDIDDINGHTNYPGVGASGSVDFTDPTKVTVIINNDNTASSFITGFYILKPVLGDTSLADATVINSITPDDGKIWGLDDDKFGSVLNEFYSQGNNYVGDYFGAEIKNSPDTNGLPNPSTYTFDIAIDTGGFPPVDWLAYENRGVGENAVPHIFVRWQNVNNGDSAKGYDTWGDIPPPPTQVPEPSEIAAMGLFGMLGLLWIRRRFINRKKK